LQNKGFLKLVKLLKTDSSQYIITKYFAYGLRFITALIIAKNLSVYYFGIYGFVILVLQYLSYTNFGTNYSFNVILSTDKKIYTEKANLLLSNTLNFNIYVSILLVIIALLSSALGVLGYLHKYLFGDYYLLVIFIAIIQNYNVIFINLFRIYGKLFEINFNIIIIVLSQFTVTFFYNGKELFWALLLSLTFGNILSLVVFLFKSPLKIFINFKFQKNILKNLLSRGIYLLLYNLSFYLIIISARTIVSYYYTVEDFSLFTFANSLSNAVLMLLASLSFLFYPKLLNKFSNYKNLKDIIQFMRKIREIYLTMSFLIVLSSLLFIPLIFRILPKYEHAYFTLEIMLIAQLLISNNFDYTILLIQRKKEKLLTVFGFIAVGIVVITSIIFVSYLHLSFDFVAVSILLSTFGYNIIVIFAGNKVTKQFNNILSLLNYAYPCKYTLPLIVLFVLQIFKLNNFVPGIIALVLFIYMNKKEIKYSIKEGITLLLKKDVVKIMS